MCITVALVISVCSFPVDYLRYPEKGVIHEMFDIISGHPITSEFSRRSPCMVT
jgi:hypothetical protein